MVLTIIAYRPHPPVWFPPVHFPAELVIGTVFDIQGSSCLDSRPSELSLLGSPGLPPSTSAGRSDTGICPILPHRHWPSNRGKKLLASPILRLNQLRAGTRFRRLVRSLWLRPSWLLAPGADPTEVVRCPPGRLGLLRPGFQLLGSPRELPDITTAPHGDLRPAGLAPASQAVSFAALPPAGGLLPSGASDGSPASTVL